MYGAQPIFYSVYIQRNLDFISLMTCILYIQVSQHEKRQKTRAWKWLQNEQKRSQGASYFFGASIILKNFMTSD